MKKLAIGMMVFCSLMMVSGAAWCVNNGNGTVTVNGLVWLEDAGCLGRMNWNDATTRPKSLAHGQCGLKDRSMPGDWRLPTIYELKAVSSAKGQFRNVQPVGYWSSSTYLGDISNAWYVIVGGGFVDYGNKADNAYVWPVRAGQ